MHIQEVGEGDWDSIELAQDRDRWREPVSTVKNLCSWREPVSTVKNLWFP
jgi:hypothetical protein